MPFRKKVDNGAERLAGVSFFADFTPKELARVGELVEEVDAEAGAELTEQGRPGLECYVVVDGEAGVYVNGQWIAKIGPGEMIGEMALIDHKPRSATVLAVTPMRLLSLDSKQFRTLLEEMPKAASAIMSRLSERLRKDDVGG